MIKTPARERKRREASKREVRWVEIEIKREREKRRGGRRAGRTPAAASILAKGHGTARNKHTRRWLSFRVRRREMFTK